MGATKEFQFHDMTPSSSEWMSTFEAALYLRLFKKDKVTPSEASVRNLVNQGKIPFYKPLGSLRFKRSELKQFMESSRYKGR